MKIILFELSKSKIEFDSRESGIERQRCPIGRLRFLIFLYFGQSEAEMRKCAGILWVSLRNRSPHFRSFAEIAIVFKPESLLRGLRVRDTGKRREQSHESKGYWGIQVCHSRNSLYFS